METVDSKDKDSISPVGVLKEGYLQVDLHADKFVRNLKVMSYDLKFIFAILGTETEILCNKARCARANIRRIGEATRGVRQ